MSAQELRSIITTTPFRPFTLNVADGRRIPVIGRDFVLVSPNGRSVHVYQPDSSFDWLDMLMVTGASFEAQPATSANGPTSSSDA